MYSQKIGEKIIVPQIRQILGKYFNDEGCKGAYFRQQLRQNWKHKLGNKFLADNFLLNKIVGNIIGQLDTNEHTSIVRIKYFNYFTVMQ